MMSISDDAISILLPRAVIIRQEKRLHPRKKSPRKKRSHFFRGSFWPSVAAGVVFVLLFTYFVPSIYKDFLGSNDQSEPHHIESRWEFTIKKLTLAVLIPIDSGNLSICNENGAIYETIQLDDGVGTTKLIYQSEMLVLLKIKTPKYDESIWQRFPLYTRWNAEIADIEVYI